MKMHTITVELDARDVTDDQAEQLMTSLEQLHPAVSTSPRGWLSATITIPAEHVGQAAILAIAAVEQAAGHPAVAVTAMTETEADAREGWETPTELVSVSEAAELLGVSRQAVLDRISRHTLPASKIGRDYTIPRAALGLSAAAELGSARQGLAASVARTAPAKIEGSIKGAVTGSKKTVDAQPAAEENSSRATSGRRPTNPQRQAATGRRAPTR